MGKKSFWKGISDFLKSDDPKIITDEEWEAMQATQEADEALPEEAEAPDETAGAAEPAEWRCPECHYTNPASALFCGQCGYHPGTFRDIAAQLTDEELNMVLTGRCPYPPEEHAILERELARRRALGRQQQDEDVVLDETEYARLAAEYGESAPAQLYEVLENMDYTPEARQAARAELGRRGLPLFCPGDEAPTGWKCAACGTQNPEAEYFCQKCGEYRY